MKRIISLLLTLTMLLGVFTACGTSKTPEDSSTPTTSTVDAGEDSGKDTEGEENPYAEEIVITATRGVTETIIPEIDYTEQLLKEKFNLVVEYEDYPINDWATKLSLLFASNQAPEYIPGLRVDYKAKEWISAGYIRPYTMEEIETRLPNYMNLWTEEEWDEVYKYARFGDGNLYYIPSKQNSKMALGYMYRKEAFDRLGLDFPTTADELYDVLVAIKEDTGLVPYHRDGGGLWYLTGFYLMFGLNELILRDNCNLDGATGEFTSYALGDDKYRDMYIYLHKLYEEGLIWQEFATATTDQANKFKHDGNGFIMMDYVSNLDEMNTTYKENVPDVEWVVSDDYITAVPEVGTYVRRDPLFNVWGPGFTQGTDEAKIERVMDYINWACSEEGLLFSSFGVEDVTYKFADDKPELLPEIRSSENPEGVELGNYGIGNFIYRHPEYFRRYNNGYITEPLEEHFLNREGYYYNLEPYFLLTAEEEKRATELQTNLDAKRDEYMLKFVMGKLDPSNDAHWEEYQEVLDGVGRQEFIEIRTAGFEQGKTMD